MIFLAGVPSRTKSHIGSRQRKMRANYLRFKTRKRADFTEFWMIRIVSLRTGRVGKGQHTGHRSSDGAENPAHRQSHKDDAAGLSENPKKRIEKRRPCRYRSGHTNLRVVYGLRYPLQPSVGWYFFVRKSSILAA